MGNTSTSPNSGGISETTDNAWQRPVHRGAVIHFDERVLTRDVNSTWSPISKASTGLTKADLELYPGFLAAMQTGVRCGLSIQTSQHGHCDAFEESAVRIDLADQTQTLESGREKAGQRVHVGAGLQFAARPGLR